MFKKLAAMLGLVSVSASCSESAPISWPDLPTNGFMVGKPATTDDVAAGNAVFSMAGKSLGVLAIDIPQYVFWTDEKGVKHPMILVQAEKAPDGSEIVGLRAFDGSETAGTLPEIKLLGKSKPTK